MTKDEVHALAGALWRSGWYEARMLAAMLDDPERVTRAQMEAWVRDFDNWGLCDTVCWHLFDYTPFAWEKLRKWSKSPHEFVKRAAFVRKAVSWALRRIAHRSPPLHKAAVDLARRLAASEQHSARWVGRDVLRDVSRPMVRARLGI